MADDAKEWTDEEFLGYFELHSETPRALFHRDHVLRLLKMAGSEPPANRFPEWMAVHDDVAKPLIERARALKVVDEVHAT